MRRGSLTGMGWPSRKAATPRSRAAAQMEADKAFAKEIMARHEIPTGFSESFTDEESAMSYLDEVGAPIVVKADGLAAGKGVSVCASAAEAERGCDQHRDRRDLDRPDQDREDVVLASALSALTQVLGRGG